MEKERGKISNILFKIYDHIKMESDKYINTFPEDDSREERIIDFIAGMTDNYALQLYKNIKGDIT